MGMDVYGRAPTGKAGKYFRANIWAWEPIHHLIVELCSDLFDEEALLSMSLNEGAGPLDQATCTEMALRFEQWLANHPRGHTIESDLRVTEEGRFVSDEELAADATLKTESPLSVSNEHLKQWVTFLRSCGGFEVC